MDKLAQDTFETLSLEANQLARSGISELCQSIAPREFSYTDTKEMEPERQYTPQEVQVIDMEARSQQLHFSLYS